MKIIFLILAFSAVALCTPAKDDKYSVKNRRESHYDANLKFDWTGENSWKAKIEAMFKPIADALNKLGFKGDLLKDFNGKNNGHITGNFHFSGNRGDGKSNVVDTRKTPSENDVSYSKTETHPQSPAIQNPPTSRIGRNSLSANLPSPSIDVSYSNYESQPNVIQNPPPSRVGRNSLSANLPSPTIDVSYSNYESQPNAIQNPLSLRVGRNSLSANLPSVG